MDIAVSSFSIVIKKFELIYLKYCLLIIFCFADGVTYFLNKIATLHTFILTCSIQEINVSILQARTPCKIHF